MTDQAQPITPPATPITGCDAVRAEASKYSDWDPNIITAIAHEEGLYQGQPCNVEAHGDGHLTFQVNGKTYGYSVSALQVRILPGREHCDAYDIKINVECAHAIWQGQGYGAWTMYNNGKYRQWL